MLTQFDSISELNLRSIPAFAEGTTWSRMITRMSANAADRHGSDARDFAEVQAPPRY